MNLENQNNKVKEELLTLYQMMKFKAEQIDGIAPRHELRRLEGQILQVKTILENYFDFVNEKLKFQCSLFQRWCHCLQKI